MGLKTKATRLGRRAPQRSSLHLFVLALTFGCLFLSMVFWPHNRYTRLLFCHPGPLFSTAIFRNLHQTPEPAFPNRVPQITHHGTSAHRHRSRGHRAFRPYFLRAFTLPIRAP